MAYKKPQAAKVIAIRHPRPPVSEKRTLVNCGPNFHRAIIQIGKDRFALHFEIEITRLDPKTDNKPAPVIQINRGRKASARRARTPQ